MNARVIATLILLVSAIASMAPALDTTRIDFREGQESDGEVAVFRSEGRLYFDDETTTVPLALEALAGPASAHAELSGLDADDHPHYQTASRHTAAHDAALNAALPIPEDLGGNDTLGGHVGDARIHLDREAAESISGS